MKKLNKIMGVDFILPRLFLLFESMILSITKKIKKILKKSLTSVITYDILKT